MAITIEIYPKPVLSLELVEGGSLDANQEYYFIGFHQSGAAYYGNALSQASNQVSIATTYTQRPIRIGSTTDHNHMQLVDFRESYRIRITDNTAEKSAVTTSIIT